MSVVETLLSRTLHKNSNFAEYLEHTISYIIVYLYFDVYKSCIPITSIISQGFIQKEIFGGEVGVAVSRTVIPPPIKH